ncbi:MAG: hypothetical protein ACE5GD_07470 [Candidatus Geothermarchaeales archaeon]
MRIIPLSFDSMGVRSMATYVETEDAKILIDPGVALAPRRFGLPPHPIELERKEEDWRQIVDYAGRSDILVVTHYHYDHHESHRDTGVYGGKTVLIKHPLEMINFSQRNRAAYFLDRIGKLPKKVENADGRKFTFGETQIKFSKPVFHGADPRLGYVVEVMVDDGEKKLIHSSDVEGPAINDQVEFILESEPNVVILDGPLTYMLDYKYDQRSLEKSMANILLMMDRCPLEVLILDHHLLREANWRERMRGILHFGEKTGIKVMTASEYVGKPLNLLEARRVELYERHPV